MVFVYSHPCSPYTWWLLTRSTRPSFLVSVRRWWWWGANATMSTHVMWLTWNYVFSISFYDIFLMTRIIWKKIILEKSNDLTILDWVLWHPGLATYQTAFLGFICVSFIFFKVFKANGACWLLPKLTSFNHFYYISIQKDLLERD